MIKRYLGITLITATLLVTGCSSDNDDDGGSTTEGTTTEGTTTDGTTTDGTTTDGTTTDGTTTDGTTTDGTTTDGTTTDGTTTDGTTTDGTTTDGTTTGGTTTGGVTGPDFAIGGTVDNSNATTGRADAVIRVVHSSDNAGTVFVTADEANSAPLIGDALDPTSGLTVATGAVGPVAIDAGDHTIEVIKAGDFFASNFSPVLNINKMTLGAGSSTTFIARGDAIDAGSDTPLEMVSVFNQTTTDSVDGGLVRVIHAARGLSIVFDGLTTGSLDLFATTDGVVNGTPAISDFSYGDVSTGYVELPAAVYEFVATEAGNSARERFSATVDVSVGSVTTVIVRDGAAFGMDADLVVIDDAVNP
ncbi:MAG: DUF4397 domain-containing protein [Granulosicoccus sp.]|nr:DUF4397 domain-containing protein [Granulosicoccus sp.]